MKKLLKFDVKRNNKIITRLMIVNAIFLAFAIVFHLFVKNLNLTFTKEFIRIIFIGGILFFIFENFIYLLSLVDKDFTKANSYLIFSLPLSSKTYLTSKIVNFSIFYIINLMFLLGFYKLFYFNIESDLVYYFAIALICFVLFLLARINKNVLSNFKENKSAGIIVVIFLALIILIAYIICKYFSLVFVNSSLQLARPMDYAFVFPFAIGKYGIYKNLTPFIYYLLITLGIFVKTSKFLENNIDLP